MRTIAGTSDSDPTASAPSARARGSPRWLAALWRARGWWGGILAVALAAQGERMLLAGENAAVAGGFYLAAFVLLVAVLFGANRPLKALPGGYEAEAAAPVSPPARPMLFAPAGLAGL